MSRERASDHAAGDRDDVIWSADWEDASEACGRWMEDGPDSQRLPFAAEIDGLELVTGVPRNCQRCNENDAAEVDLGNGDLVVVAQVPREPPGCPIGTGHEGLGSRRSDHFSRALRDRLPWRPDRRGQQKCNHISSDVEPPSEFAAWPESSSPAPAR